jgi:hypothetical protein
MDLLTANPNPMFTFNISKLLKSSDYLPMANDVVRMLVIQVTIQLMVFLASPSTVAFFSTEFVLLLTYIVLGVLMYWLVVRQIVALR